ncbi:hypothetical protein HWV62_6617 [Athelia sp. TMB]|nr:hypothetical protein HWV62_28437 [Athelia sp. TMB]KAF7985375.1 hypothetical protein HWV62_6617 [Athelia sp. TMB]
MYATATHVQQVHHPPYNPHHQVITNGHAHQNGASHHQPSPPTQPPHRTAPPPAAAKEPIVVVGVPSVSIQNNRLQVGDSQSTSTRSYTPLKVLGDGSFGTVWLCDWHGTLPPNTPLSPMQCGAGARPEWAGKRLVAVKRMKKQWQGGWDECKKLKELESLREIPFHPNIIPLYDFFLLPESKELYFVFESMEGNLYHLIKARKGRALAGGLVASIFRQIVSGLFHIHGSGYFHRDMKPENVLVTTTGLFDYQSVSPVALPNAPPEKDVVAIIKLADFGLARETKSKPPYTEYVSTRWYRAPEVLLLSRDYSNPVDMWALGTIMAELVNLRPLFPGSGQIDQMARICELMGDPTDDYGTDARGRVVGGGKWTKGIKMAKAVGFAFPKLHPRDFYSLFDRSVPRTLIDCIADLLRYDPEVRLTSRECMQHPYLLETIPRNNIPMPAALSIQTSTSSPARLNQRHNVPSATSLSAISPRNLPPSHSHHSAPNSSHPTPSHLHPSVSHSHRAGFYDSRASSGNDLNIYEQNRSADTIEEHPRNRAYNGDSSPPSQGDWYMEDPRPDPSSYHSNGHPMEIQGSPMVQEYPSRPPMDPDSMTPSQVITGHDVTPQSGNKLGKFGALGFGKKHSKWGLGSMFGHGDKHHALPPVEEIPIAGSSSSTPSLKRTQSSSTDSRSLSELSPVVESPHQMDPKMAKKEAERLHRDAEKQRRAMAEKANREQARAVMQKRNQVQQPGDTEFLEWKYHLAGSMAGKQRPDGRTKSKHGASSGPIRQSQGQGNAASSTTVSAAAGRFDGSKQPSSWRGSSERQSKARRREFDDDHSMSSSEVHSLGRMSALSFATVDSDPGPTSLRHRPSHFSINRMASASSLRTATSFDDFPSSARSSSAFSAGESLAQEFHSRANMDGSGTISPPPMQMLSLSPPSPWLQQSPGPNDPSRPNYISSSHHISNGNGPHSPYPSSPGGLSTINPIFKVTSLPAGDGTLPPFSHLEAVAEHGEYPPLSPMSFRENSAEDS